MLCRWMVLFVLCFFSTFSHAQEKGFERPDYKNIERVTKDKSSENYFPKLLSRYQSNDTTLSVEQFKLLYYGFFFQEGYSSFSLSPFNDSLKQLYKKEKLTDDDNRKLIQYTIGDLKASPFSLRDLYRLYRLYTAAGDETTANRYLFKLEMLSKAIASTGDAMTDTTGLHVLSVEDEYTIISMLGYEFGGEQKLTGHPCDYLTLKKNSDNVEGLYFDVTQIFAGYNRALGGNSDKRNKK